MELFRNLRVKAGYAFLAFKLAKIRRKPFFCNFRNIKTIGVVWDASESEEFPLLSRFYHNMSDKNVDVTIFGYYSGKELPNQYTAIRYLTCVKRQELDFFYRPVSHEASVFTRRPFDVLIDINCRKLFPLHYITALSTAALKVGLTDSQPEASPFDMMISLKKPVMIESYLDQVLFYLTMINSDTEKKAV